jgi:hypothetical protein
MILESTVIDKSLNMSFYPRLLYSDFMKRERTHDVGVGLHRTCHSPPCQAAHAHIKIPQAQPHLSPRHNRTQSPPSNQFLCHSITLAQGRLLPRSLIRGVQRRYTRYPRASRGTTSPYLRLRDRDTESPAYSGLRIACSE